jgi:signal transduction histidine kinase
MLLFLARADAEARAPSLEMIDLSAWVEEYLRNQADQHRAADLRLGAPSGVPLRVGVQPALLGQLVDNLLDNAWKFSAPGTPVTLRLGAEAGLVTLTVEDRGCGIAPEDLPHVFEPFYRAHRGQGPSSPGVGLGLAVVQRIAESFGGKVSAESNSGGSRFRVQLPQFSGNPQGEKASLA